MVVDQPSRLHERIDDRGADEAKSALDQVMRQRVGLRCTCRNGGERSEAVDARRSADEFPDIAVEASETALDLQKCASIADRALDFARMTNDRRIGHEAFDVPIAERG